MPVKVIVNHKIFNRPDLSGVNSRVANAGNPKLARQGSVRVGWRLNHRIPDYLPRSAYGTVFIKR